MKRNSNVGVVAASLILLALSLDARSSLGQARSKSAPNAHVSSTPIVINATGRVKPPSKLPFSVGGQSPDGHVLSANRRYLTFDGKPWFPVMGEFHYSRYPEAEWEGEIQKMKAAGIQIISTYVFWIHHEEIEGDFDWTGQRDLRHFIELCARNNVYVWIRVGPWDHGEVRNGGLPDWLAQKTPTRENNPIYLAAVERFFHEIGKQVRGMFWKDGGPIIGAQIENEYSARGPGKGADHILKLHDLALGAGLDAPFFTITGWDNAVIPPHDVLPVFGGYADGFWWRSLEERPPSPNYFFTKIRCEENVGDDLRSKRPDIDALDLAYPFLTAEMGGGMANSYHRRPQLSPGDTAAMQLVKMGSGVVLYGYYMFHGGTNPEGKKTTLQESQATGYPNDLPVKGYDFQAPIGEFGQMNPSFGVLKTLNLFLGDFGESLAPMISYSPRQLPKSKRDTETPRVAARIQDGRGFIFINSYERTYELAEQKNFQIRLKLNSGAIDVPRFPVDIPSGTYTIWPVNLDAGGMRLRYSTAQLLCKLDAPNTLVFFAWPGISPEFAFEEKTGDEIESAHGKIVRERGITYVNGIEPGTAVAIRVHPRNGIDVNIVVLSREQAVNAWKADAGGRDRLILSSTQVFFDHDVMHVVSDNATHLTAEFFPALEHTPAGFNVDAEDGIFQRYSARVQPVQMAAQLQKAAEPGADPPPRMGKEMMGATEALAPEDSDFDTAARWTLQVPCSDSTKAFLRIAYKGDVARLYADGKLIADNFYNGSPWVIGLNRVPCRDWDHLELKILPLRNQSPIYLPAGARPAASPSGQTVTLEQVLAVPEYEVLMDLKH